jgi:hypothetical protein
MATGARLRLVEATTTSINANTIPTVPAVIGNPIGSATFPPLALQHPDPAKNYRATVVCDVYNPTTNVAAQVELYLDTSQDAGATWQEQASNSHIVGFSTSRQIRLDLPMRPGSSFPVAAGAAALQLRCRIGASTNGGNVVLYGPLTPGGDTAGVGCVDLQFEELLGGVAGA